MLGIVCIAGWSGLLTCAYFTILNYKKALRLDEPDELLGGDIYYFAPIKMAGTISSYTKGLELTRLNSEFTRASPQRRPRANRVSASSLLDN